MLLIGKNVVNHDGELMGKVRRVIRKGNRNNINEIIVKSFLRKDFSVKMSQIKSINKVIMLKQKHGVKKKYFWQKSE